MYPSLYSEGDKHRGSMLVCPLEAPLVVMGTCPSLISWHPLYPAFVVRWVTLQWSSHRLWLWSLHFHLMLFQAHLNHWNRCPQDPHPWKWFQNHQGGNHWMAWTWMSVLHGLTQQQQIGHSSPDHWSALHSVLTRNHARDYQKSKRPWSQFWQDDQTDEEKKKMFWARKAFVLMHEHVQHYSTCS